MDTKLKVVEVKPGEASQSPKVAVGLLFEQLRENGGHVYVGEYRGSAAQTKEAFDKTTGKTNPGKKYVQLTHSIEIRERGIAKMYLFKEKDATETLDPDAVIARVPFKRGQCVAILNPWIMEREGQKFYGFNPGAMTVLE